MVSISHMFSMEKSQKSIFGFFRPNFRAIKGIETFFITFLEVHRYQEARLALYRPSFLADYSYFCKYMKDACKRLNFLSKRVSLYRHVLKTEGLLNHMALKVRISENRWPTESRAQGWEPDLKACEIFSHAGRKPFLKV